MTTLLIVAIVAGAIAGVGIWYLLDAIFIMFGRKPK